MNSKTALINLSLLILTACTQTSEIIDPREKIRNKPDTPKDTIPTHEVAMDPPEVVKPVQKIILDDIKSFEISRVYLPQRLGLGASSVVQQEKYKYEYVSREPNTFSQFGLGCRTGILDPETAMNCFALLAHNYNIFTGEDLELGTKLDSLVIGDEIDVVTEAHQLIKFRLVDLQSFEAIGADGYSGTYRNLETGSVTNSEGIFRAFYVGNGEIPHLTMQYCFYFNGSPFGGREFAMFYPIELIDMNED